MLETKPKVAQSKADLLTILRAHRDAVITAAGRHGARNLRVFGPDSDGDKSSCGVLVDVVGRTNYFDLEDVSTEIEELTGYDVVLYTSDVVDQSAPGDPIREADPL